MLNITRCSLPEEIGSTSYHIVWYSRLCDLISVHITLCMMCHCEICMDIRPYHTQSLWLIMGRILEYRTLHEKRISHTLWASVSHCDPCYLISGAHGIRLCRGFYCWTYVVSVHITRMSSFSLSECVISVHITLHVMAVTVGHMWHQSIAQFFFTMRCILRNRTLNDAKEDISLSMC